MASVILVGLNGGWNSGFRRGATPRHHLRTGQNVMPKTSTHRFLSLLCVSVVLWPYLEAQSQEEPQQLEPVLRAEARINRESARSQERVSSLSQQTRELLQDYRAVVRETEALKIYNDNLERMVADQRGEIRSINDQLAGLEETNRGVVPLMLEMIDALDRIVEADIPFRIDERRARVERLRAMMDQSEVPASEKYRRVIEAYTSELEFGRSTEAYAARLPTTGQTVEFLRVGRTLLLFQSGDGALTGWFNPSTRVFEELPEHFRPEIRKGLAMARNERAPDLLLLPVPGPERTR
jgi:hypothetical protein